MKKPSYLPSDVFVAANIVLFLIMCYAVYYDRFVGYRGAANLHEFFLYACVILLAIIVMWRYFRRMHFPAWLLVVVQIGILLHFSGAFFPIEGGRLYDAILFGVRFDKYVHMYNSFAGAALICHFLELQDTRLPLFQLFVVLIVLGCGAIIEMVEYYVTLTVEQHGVGNYDNNMQDLIANLAGAVIFVKLRRPLAVAFSGLRSFSS